MDSGGVGGPTIRKTDGGVGVHRLFASLVTVAVIIGSFTVVAPQARAQGTLPEWSVGDRWEYTGTLEAGGTRFDLMQRREVRERPQMTVGSVTYDTFRVASVIDASGAAASFSITEDVWLRASDFAVVRLSRNVGAYQLSFVYDPPDQQFRFPLTPGDAWSTAVNVTTTESGKQPSTELVRTNYTVRGPQKLTVPAGTFDVVVVNATGGSYSGDYAFSDVAGYHIRAAWTAGEGELQGQSILQLRAYCYARAGGMCDMLPLVVLAVGVPIIAVVIGWGVMVVRSRRRRTTSAVRIQPNSVSTTPSRAAAQAPPESPPRRPHPPST